MEFHSAAYSYNEGTGLISEKINPFLNQLSTRSSYDKKKKTELRHIGKFLAYFYPEFAIKQLHERPDFIIQNNSRTIGVEHTVLVDSAVKRKEGYIKRVFNEVEIRILNNKNFKKENLLNCYLKPDFYNNRVKKKDLIDEILRVINHYYIHRELTENSIIEQIAEFPHSKFDILPLFTIVKQKNISNDIIFKAVRKKEAKIKEYRKNSTQEQWLLIVSSNSGRSSYNIKDDFDLKIHSSFKRIFLLEDYENNLFVLR